MQMPNPRNMHHHPHHHHPHHHHPHHHHPHHHHHHPHHHHPHHHHPHHHHHAAPMQHEAMDEEGHKRYMHDMCRRYHHYLAQFEGTDGRIYDGIIDGVDDDHVFLLEPVGDMEWDGDWDGERQDGQESHNDPYGYHYFDDRQVPFGPPFGPPFFPGRFPRRFRRFRRRRFPFPFFRRIFFPFFF